jgi:hypothetical protein
VPPAFPSGRGAYRVSRESGRSSVMEVTDRGRSPTAHAHEVSWRGALRGFEGAAAPRDTDAELVGPVQPARSRRIYQAVKACFGTVRLVISVIGLTWVIPFKGGGR